MLRIPFFPRRRGVRATNPVIRGTNRFFRAFRGVRVFAWRGVRVFSVFVPVAARPQARTRDFRRKSGVVDEPKWVAFFVRKPVRGLCPCIRGHVGEDIFFGHRIRLGFVPRTVGFVPRTRPLPAQFRTSCQFLMATFPVKAKARFVLSFQKKKVHS